MIARLPGGHGGASGSVADRPVVVWDVPATLGELAGVAVPQARDGISFAPELRGGRGPEHDYFYWQSTRTASTRRCASAAGRRSGAAAVAGRALPAEPRSA